MEFALNPLLPLSGFRHRRPGRPDRRRRRLADDAAAGTCFSASSRRPQWALTCSMRRSPRPAAQFRDQTRAAAPGRRAAADFRRRVPPAAPAERPGTSSATRRCCAWPCPTACCRPRRQLRKLAHIARCARYDRGYGHFTTRQNLQFNWIPLEDSADILDLLAEVRCTRIQTSGNCIRNITTDAARRRRRRRDRRSAPLGEILRQWSTLHPSSPSCRASSRSPSAAPRKTAPRSGGTTSACSCVRNEAGEIGFRSGRRHGPHAAHRPGDPRVPALATPADYIEAILRVYNRYGRRDNKYKARIKILVKAEAEEFARQVEASNGRPQGRPRTLTAAEVERVAAHFVAPPASAWPRCRRHLRRTREDKAFYALGRAQRARAQGARLRAVTLSLKRAGAAAGRRDGRQMDAAADWPSASASANCASPTSRT
jgi:hypothetical protein